MEAVFRALGDRSRRLLLDRLYERDGQTLGELDAHLEDMTRFGVMKHLRILEEAGLVTTRRVGREKLHYLNPVPIRLVHDRWISKYAEPWVGALGALKRGLEDEMASTEPAAGATATRAPMHVYEVYIRTTPERLWEAITSADDTRRYFYGSGVESDWRAGSPVVYRMPDGGEAIRGEVVEVDRPRRLVHTFSADWVEQEGDAPSRVTWEIEPAGEGAVKLTLTHDDFGGETATYRSVDRGWNIVLSGLKTLVETGEPLVVAA